MSGEGWAADAQALAYGGLGAAGRMVSTGPKPKRGGRLGVAGRMVSTGGGSGIARQGDDGRKGGRTNENPASSRQRG